MVADRGRVTQSRRNHFVQPDAPTATAASGLPQAVLAGLRLWFSQHDARIDPAPQTAGQGVVAVQSRDLSRTDRERLVANGRSDRIWIWRESSWSVDGMGVLFLTASTFSGAPRLFVEQQGQWHTRFAVSRIVGTGNQSVKRDIHT